MANPDESADQRRPRTPRPARAANPEARMPLLDHIRELRNRVFKMLLALAAGAVLGWFVYPYVWHFIEAPYCRLHLHSELMHGQNCTLYVTGLFDSLFLRLKIALITGVIVSSPLWMYQLWAFIAPGLYHRERRWAYLFAGSAVPLFALGGTIAYFAMTKGLHFLIALVPANVVPIITINTYLGYAIAMLLIFGLAFEFPLVLVLLNLAGVLPHQRFRKWRRMIIFVVFLFAAIFTPSPDPISMLLLAVPCVVLVEVAEVFAWANDRRRARRLGLSPYPGISPDELIDLDVDDESRDGVEAGRSSQPG